MPKLGRTSFPFVFYANVCKSLKLRTFGQRFVPFFIMNGIFPEVRKPMYSSTGLL